MNTITYYDVINDTTAIYEFKQSKASILSCAREMFKQLIMPIHYYVNKIEITNSNIIVNINEKNVEIIKEFNLNKITSCYHGLDIIKDIFTQLKNNYLEWIDEQKYFRETSKISIMYSMYDEDEEDYINESDFLKTIEIIDRYYSPFDDLEKLYEFMTQESNYKDGFIGFEDLNNISFNTIWYKKFFGQISKRYCIHQINRIDEHNNIIEILYSDGICTNGIKHICGEARKWFIDCKNKISNINQSANNHFNNLLAP